VFSHSVPHFEFFTLVTVGVFRLVELLLLSRRKVAKQNEHIKEDCCPIESATLRYDAVAPEAASFFRNVGTLLLDCTASHPRLLQF